MAMAIAMAFFTQIPPPPRGLEREMEIFQTIGGIWTQAAQFPCFTTPPVFRISNLTLLESFHGFMDVIIIWIYEEMKRRPSTLEQEELIEKRRKVFSHANLKENCCLFYRNEIT